MGYMARNYCSYPHLGRKRTEKSPQIILIQIEKIKNKIKTSAS
jgi:hypothetical protein